MFWVMAKSRAEVLRELTLESENPARVERLQVMIVALGDGLGFDSEELWAWRSAVVVGESGQSLPESRFSEIEMGWLVMDHEYEFRHCCLVAEAWDAEWQAGQADLRSAVWDRVEALVRPEVLAAFDRVLDVIVPLRA
jgi:hypothetical protein